MSVTDRPRFIAGVDEAGRGPLAGPVAAAAVILDAGRPIAGLADSKRLSDRGRRKLVPLIEANSRSFAVAFATVAEIDELNILQATLLAMRRAVIALNEMPTLVRVDGNRAPAIPFAVETVVRGDSKHAEIGAASILAKVARDDFMLALSAQYPHYGFEQHKGYPTRKHLAALERFGPTVHHRQSFAPVRDAGPVSLG